MEEQEIKEKFPSLYEVLTENRILSEYWKPIHQDFIDLLWLHTEDGEEEKVVQGIILICDRIGQQFLNKLPVFITFDLNQVKLFIHDSIYTLISQKDKAKETCNKCKKLANDMEFFKASAKLLQAASDDEAVELAQNIEEAYKEFKKVLVNATLQLEKSIQSEYDKSFGELLDEIFYSGVLAPNKTKLKNHSETISIIQDYKGNGFFRTRNYTGGYYSSFPKSENIYIGEARENKKEGYGKMYFNNRDVYEGFWKNDRPEGQGLYLWKDGGKYMGGFHLGLMEGFGKRLYSSGSYYEGEFLNGKRSGKGVMKFKNGDEYDGEWVDEDMQGRGMYKWASGDVYVGEFKRDKREGKGTLTLSTGEIYDSTWENGSMKKATEKP